MTDNAFFSKIQFHFISDQLRINSETAFWVIAMCESTQPASSKSEVVSRVMTDKSRVSHRSMAYQAISMGLDMTSIAAYIYPGWTETDSNRHDLSVNGPRFPGNFLLWPTYVV